MAKNLIQQNISIINGRSPEVIDNDVNNHDETNFGIVKLPVSRPLHTHTCRPVNLLEMGCLLQWVWSKLFLF